MFRVAASCYDFKVRTDIIYCHIVINFIKLVSSSGVFFQNSCNLAQWQVKVVSCSICNLLQVASNARLLSMI